MIIVLIIYVFFAWLVFFQLKLLPWNWPWRLATALIGACILLIFVALLNTLAPSGRIAVVGRVVEVTPNVAGTVTSIPVTPNTLVTAGTILFQVRSRPYEAKVRQLQAAVAEARQKVEQLEAQVELAAADVKGVSSQLAYAEKRRDDIQSLSQTNSASVPTRRRDCAGGLAGCISRSSSGNQRKIGAWFRNRRGEYDRRTTERPTCKRQMGAGADDGSRRR